MPAAEFQAIVLDLYDTLVKWEPNRLPEMDWQGRKFRSTIPLLIPRLRQALDGESTLDDCIAAYLAVTEEIMAQRHHDEPLEVTCNERFVRALARIKLRSGESIPGLAEELTRTHMANVRRVTFAPPERVDAVRRLRLHFRLGLLSNFDDADTGRGVLHDTGVADSFEAVIISAEAGVRKPHPRIFRQMLRLLGIEPHMTLFVGDTARDDVLGAQRVGMRTVWINPKDAPLPAGLSPPDFMIRDLAELPAVLGI